MRRGVVFSSLVDKGVCWIIAPILLFQPAISDLHGQEVTYSGSLEFASGDYLFAERTLSLYLYNGLTIAEGPFRFSTDIPLIMQSTEWVSYGGAGMFANGGMHDTTADQGGGGGMMDMSLRHGFGIGDPVSRLDLEVLREGEILPSLRLVTQVKFPLVDIDYSFGTGEWDYGGGILLSKSTLDRFAFLELTYWRLGDTPDVELMNPIAYNIALGQPLAGGEYAVVFSLSGYSTIVEEVDPAVQLGIGLTQRTGSTRIFTLSTAIGLTESAPDFTLSLDWLVGWRDEI